MSLRTPREPQKCRLRQVLQVGTILEDDARLAKLEARVTRLEQVLTQHPPSESKKILILESSVGGSRLKASHVQEHLTNAGFDKNDIDMAYVDDLPGSVTGYAAVFLVTKTNPRGGFSDTGPAEMALWERASNAVDPEFGRLILAALRRDDSAQNGESQYLKGEYKETKYSKVANAYAIHVWLHFDLIPLNDEKRKRNKEVFDSVKRIVDMVLSTRRLSRG